MTAELVRRMHGGLAHRFRRVRGALVGSVTRVRTDEPAAALTFDDGPHPEFTPRLLEILSENGARATFFMVGENASRHPELVARVAAEGHAVANHTWSHAKLPAIDHRERLSELRRCQDALGPSATRLFRPPRTLQSPGSYLSTRMAGYDVVAWSVQAEDWKARTADAMARDLEKWIRPGAIALLHDRLADPTVPAARDRTPLLKAVDRVLSSRTDLQFVTVPELLEMGQPVRTPWFVRSEEDWDDAGNHEASPEPVRTEMSSVRKI